MTDKILSVKEMQAYESAYINTTLSASALMERAGTMCAYKIIKNYFKQGQTGLVSIFCGPGGNGGDGLVIGRILAHNNIQSVCFLVPPSNGRLKDLTAQNKKRALYADVSVTDIAADTSRAAAYVQKSYIVVDALLGLGAGAGYAPRPIFQAVADVVNAGSNIISIDGPSGIEMDNGKKYLERPVVAAETYVLGFMKRGLLEPCAAEYVGKLSVLDIFA